MTKTVKAKYSKGVIEPLEPLWIEEGRELVVTIEEERNKVTITSPKEGDQIGSRIVVKGTSAIHDKSHIWVLVHLKPLGNQWWPQTRPVVDENGTWQALSYIGIPD